MQDHWLVGKTLGNLEIVCQLREGEKKLPQFLCRCICGDEVIRHYQSLYISYHRKTMSGCHKCKGRAHNLEKERDRLEREIEHQMRKAASILSKVAELKLERLKISSGRTG